jgi:hypothetical protein
MAVVVMGALATGACTGRDTMMSGDKMSGDKTMMKDDMKKGDAVMEKK